MTKCVATTLAVLLLVLAPKISQAQTLVTTNSAWINGTAAGDGTSGTGASVVSVNPADIYLGRAGSNVVGVAVYAFQLPNLAFGESIASASLTIRNLTNSNTLTSNIDLYGLNYRAASTITTADYFVGTLDTTGATLIDENWFTLGSTPALNTFFTTTGDTGATLANYLNAQYTAGAVGGNYVFLRLNNDVFNVDARMNPTGSTYATESYRPYISYTVVPEPGTVALLSGGLMLLLFKRRRLQP